MGMEHRLYIIVRDSTGRLLSRNRIVKQDRFPYHHRGDRFEEDFFFNRLKCGKRVLPSGMASTGSALRSGIEILLAVFLLITIVKKIAKIEKIVKQR